jgi:hypothetical protein
VRARRRPQVPRGPRGVRGSPEASQKTARVGPNLGPSSGR